MPLPLVCAIPSSSDWDGDHYRVSPCDQAKALTSRVCLAGLEEERKQSDREMLLERDSLCKPKLSKSHREQGLLHLNFTCRHSLCRYLGGSLGDPGELYSNCR